VHGTSLGDALAAIVRIEGDKVAAKTLVKYGSRGPESAPKFVAFGPEHILLVSASGSVRRCDYGAACRSVRAGTATDLAAALPLPDGSMVLLDFDHAVTRLAADGSELWTRQLSAFSLLGASADEVWVKTRPDDPLASGMPIAALSLRDGKRSATPGIVRTQDRDPLGRFLEITGVAQTPNGAVVRGTFGGALTSGARKLETKIRGAVCWWENPHDGDERDIELDGSCSGRYEKAIITERAGFIATDPRELRQPR
jgi:hypothetical protein